jgi:hypothetical protein
MPTPKRLLPTRCPCYKREKGVIESRKEILRIHPDYPVFHELATSNGALISLCEK